MIIQGIFNNLGASFGKSISLRHNITSQEIHGIFAAEEPCAGRPHDDGSVAVVVSSEVQAKVFLQPHTREMIIRHDSQRQFTPLPK